MPHGTPTQSLLLYGQNKREDRFQVWSDDYNHWFNIDEKHQTDLIDLGNINIPVALFVADSDKIGDPTDAQNIKSAISDHVVEYKEIPGGHFTFLIGKDMTWFSEDVMGLLTKYHPASASENSIEQNLFDTILQ